ncbi:MAG: hypothetical protein ABIV06_03270 [Thermoanaerobaculia bacterium]
MRHQSWLGRAASIAGIAGAIAAGASFPAGAQPPLPVGLQALANTTTTGNQDESAVAVDPNGNFLVVWRDEFLDGSASAIIGRRFSARTGLPLSNEFLINLSTDGDQRNPAIAIADDGRFVVVWEGPDSLSPLTPGIFASLRQANGTAIVAEFPVNTGTSGVQRRPAVAMQPGGGFFIVWQDNTPIGFNPLPDENIAGRLYPANFPATPPGNPFQINTGTIAGDQEQPAVAPIPSTGGWLAGWQGPFSPSLIPSIFVRVLDAGGSGTIEQVVNSSSNAVQRSHVALATNSQGDAVAVWEAPDASFRGIFARRIDAGVPSAAEEQVNLTTSLDEREPSVAIDQRGAFVTVWVVASPTAFGAWEETPEGSPIIIQGRKKSTGGRFAELDDSLTPPADSEFRVDTSGSAFVDPWVTTEPRGNFVVAWQGTDPTDPQGNGVFYRGFRDAVFADGFETQNTTRWSATFPP